MWAKGNCISKANLFMEKVIHSGNLLIAVVQVFDRQILRNDREAADREQIVKGVYPRWYGTF